MTGNQVIVTSPDELRVIIDAAVREAAVATRPVTWVRGKTLAAASGYSVKALDKKREDGTFTAGIHYKYDGTAIVYSVEAFNQWASSLPASRRTAQT